MSAAMRNVEDIYGLSPMQQLMLTSTLTASDPGLLVNQVRYEIRGPLQLRLFRSAWDELAHRHPALRTAVLWDGLEQPVQVVRARVEVPFVEHDLTELPTEERAARLEEIYAADAAAPFELASAPLFRCTLARIAEDEHVFLWTVHHLVVDRWSHGTLFSELRAIYEALVRGVEPALEPAPAFRDYIAWLSRQSPSEADRYWTETLRGLRRPTSLSPPAVEDGDGRHGGRVVSRSVLAEATARALRERATSWRTTVASLLLAGVGVELARRSGTSDVLFGLTVSGRPTALPGVERTVGSFVNNVPVRIRWDRSRPLREAVVEVQRRQAELSAFEHVSPAAIRDVAELPPGVALFDTLVVANLDELDAPPWASIEFRAMEARLDAAYPFVLGVEASGGELELMLVHDASVDGAEVLSRLAGVLNELAWADEDVRVEALVPAASEPVPDGGGEVTPSIPGGERSASSADVAGAAGHSGDLGEAIADVWRDVLGLDRADRDQDFFDLGGTSLQGVRILRGLERITGGRHGISALFEARTLGGLIERLGGEPPEGDTGATIPRADRSAPLPLSFAQERLWALDRIADGPSVYNLPFAYRLTGPVDPERMRRSIDHLVRRHEVLRTAYAIRDDGPVQSIMETPREAWEWTVSLVEASEEMVRHRVENEAARPFDLEVGRLLRASLHRVAPDHHVLLVVSHHSVWDAWSVGVFERELSAAYAAFSAGAEPKLPALPIQYADFAAWQRERLEGDAADRDLAYWREQLDAIDPLDLPTDRPRPSVQSYRGAIRRVVIHGALTDDLKALARSEGTTLYGVLMAAFHLLLHRYSGQEDITVGTPFSGRTHAEVDGLIGMFVNTIVVRTQPGSDLTFRQLLGQVHEATTQAHEHQEVPFERLVEALRPERDLSRNPLFQVMLALQDRRDSALDLAGLEARPYPLAQDTSKFDLTLYLQETPEGAATRGIEGIWEFATDLFDQSTIARMWEHFLHLLGAIVSDPDGTLAELPMTSGAERRRLLGSGGGAVAGDEPFYLERFRAQVARTPDRVAVTHGARETTYAELDEQSSRLAHHIIDAGARPEHPIGICLHRSAELVVAMLGVLKSGASYVPLDPDYPAERLRYMLEDTEAPMLITTGALQSALPSFGGRVVLVDDLDALGGQPSTAPEIVLARDQLAYTIYTSGSTGRPKGVDVTHGNLAHFTTAMVDRPGLTADDVVLAKTTVAFDPSVVELLTTLVVGARMVIADASEVTTGKRLSRAIEACGATLLQATPATFHMLFEAGWEGRLGLRVLVGGEALPVELARRLVASCGEVWNIYGPTEGTVWSSCWLVPPEVDQVRIGTAMGDTRLLVLDERMQLTPTGILGELFVGGAGVTRGYRNQPDLTDASYVPNPFPEIPGERLYRTGDIARVLDDGTLESFGRRDNQVQLRGFRIELAEIESVLSEHDDILRAVVTVVDAGTPDARLVAYVVFAYAAALTVSEVRSYLRERLPSYMVPGLVVEMDEFPVTPSGKVDRRALPDPLARTAAPASTFSAPTTEKERLVADVWLELLDVERVGKDDNFFQLGGHSLLALRAVAEVAARDGGFIEPRAMFFQTLGQLAAKLQDG